jgi:hypothetical protein
MQAALSAPDSSAKIVARMELGAWQEMADALRKPSGTPRGWRWRALIIWQTR